MSECSYYISHNVFHPIRPGSVGLPQPGHDVHLLDAECNEVATGEEGMIALPEQDPGKFLRYWKQPEETARVHSHGFFLTGDFARRDEDGYIWVIGRIDDVIKVSGYRLGTAEIESALVSHAAVAEAACIGVPDPNEVKGNIIKAYCILRQGFEPSEKLSQALRDHVGHEMGPIAKPTTVEFVDSLPKTRSGKIMRRVLKARVMGQDEGDLSTLAD